MTFAIQTPADVVNLALTRIGYKLRVANLYDGSKAASAALNIYAQTRDALLRDGSWPFADRSVALTVLKQAPMGGYVPPIIWSTAYPPLPWIYEYAWPSDCLKVGTVKPVSLFTPDFDPHPHLFSVSNDNSFTPPQRVILSNVYGAICTYTAQVTDPTTMPQDFIETFAAELGQRLSPLLVGGNTVQLEAADAQAEKTAAAAQQG